MKMYLVVKLINLDSILSIDPLGLYSSEEEAEEWVAKLESLNQDEQNIIFDILDFNVDDEPIGLDVMKSEKKELMQEMDSVFVSLVGKGLIEQFVDENGNFCHEMTDTAKEKLGNDEYKIQLVESFIRSKETQ